MLLDLPSECVLRVLKELPVADVVCTGCCCSGMALELRAWPEHPCTCSTGSAALGVLLAIFSLPTLAQHKSMELDCAEDRCIVTSHSSVL
jgi:hypothetical protein